MGKSNKVHKIKEKETAKDGPSKPTEPNGISKALSQSKVLNNFGTYYQFARDLGIELLKGTANAQHIDALRESIQGIREYIDILESKLDQKKD